MKHHVKAIAGLAVLATSLAQPAHTEALLSPWGVLNGMRVQGELVAFEAGLRVVRADWSGFSSAVKYLQRPQYSRTGNQRTVVSKIGDLQFTEVVRNTAPGEATLEVTVTVPASIETAGVFLCFELPAHEFGGGAVEVREGGGDARVSLRETPPQGRRDFLEAQGRAVRLIGRRQQLDIGSDRPLEVRVRRDQSDHPTELNDPTVEQFFVSPADGSDRTNHSYQVYLRLPGAGVAPDQRVGANLTLKATAVPDPNPVHIHVDREHPGRPFDGIGGNFRLQFPKTDPAVTQYNLENLRVAWGRVEMPWADWDPDESVPPIETARAGRMSARVKEAMEMARTLARKGMPVIVSAWFPPKWARAPGPQPAGSRGTALNLDKLPRIRSSLADYLVFLKEAFGVEAALFSLNEPDIGVEVRQTAAEHAQFVSWMGRELAQRALSTRILLGDTAHGTPAALRYIGPSLADASLRPYVGAIAFHTWRGCTPDLLLRWGETARGLGLPLLVTEGGPDAHLHEYAGFRLEPWFQLQQAELYVRICAFSQPATIMEWQLNTDYSVLSGGGVYGEPGPLQPTQRFWILKQLAATPAGAHALPVSADQREITAAAFGGLPDGSVTVHVVNSGGQRRALLSGLPPTALELRVLVTDETQGMQEVARLTPENGGAECVLPAASYVTVMTKPTHP